VELAAAWVNGRRAVHRLYNVPNAVPIKDAADDGWRDGGFAPFSRQTLWKRLPRHGSSFGIVRGPFVVRNRGYACFFALMQWCEETPSIANCFQPFATYPSSRFEEHRRIVAGPASLPIRDNKFFPAVPSSRASRTVTTLDPPPPSISTDA